MERIIKFIPNLFTLGNLFCGFLALVFIAREQMVTAVILVGASLILDFLDGFVARALKAESKMGIELDSLADLITFGLVPGFILFQMIIITQGQYFVESTDWRLSVLLNASVAALVPMCAAYRLAKFNLIEDSTPHFKGLPTPAMTMVVLSIPLVLELNYSLNFYHPLSDQFVAVLGKVQHWDASDMWVVSLLNHSLTYQILSIVLAGLMVSNIPMLSLKLKGWSWSKNKWSYAILIWALVAYIIFVIPYIDLGPISYGVVDYLILPIFMAGYFILSFIYATFGASKNNLPADEVQS